MAVYKRGYQRYQGQQTATGPASWYCRVLRGSGYSNSAWLCLLMVVAMIWPLLCAIFIYLTNHADLLKGVSKQFQSFIQVNGKFFVIFMNFQATFAIVLAAFAGPGLIAPDLANNALPLYFSRPLSRI